MIRFNPILRAMVLLSALLGATSSVADNRFFEAIGIEAIEATGEVNNFALTNRHGENIELSQFKGDVILINFWATWCTPCLTEMPALNKLYQKYKDQGLSLLTINTDPHQTKRIETVVNKLSLSFPVLLDSDGSVMEQFEVSGMPVSFLINRQHQLVGYVAGARAWNSNSAQQLIESLLAQ